MKSSMRHGLVPVVALILAVACGTDSTGPQPDYTLSVTPSTLTILQAATGTTNVAIARTNFTDAVTLSLASAPAGITGSFSSVALTGITSTLTISAASTVPPGEYHLIVDGNASAGKRSAPVTVMVNLDPSASKAARIVAGVGYSCFLNTSGQAYCWGRNDVGQLGDGTTTQRLVPTLVAGGLTFTSLSQGGSSNLCALTGSGTAYCWGENGGALGDGTTTNRLVPTPVAGRLTFASLSAGGGHICGVTTTGAAYCWGYNDAGRLGDGTTTSRLVPTAVAGSLTFASVSAGISYTCGVTTNGAAYCWGSNYHGESGNSGIYTVAPTAVSGGLTFERVSASWFHTCAMTAGGGAYCWGDNTVGQLGDGTTTSRQVPRAVAGGLTFDAVSAGSNGYSCGATTSGAAYCWGQNPYGQLGDGTTTNKSVPTPVAGGITFAAVSASLIPDGPHTCGMSTSGAVYCWGLNDSGQLGDGTTTQRLLPTLVAFP